MKTYEQHLFENSYPGRTIIVGMTPSGSHYVQVYWIMGRSFNSRNRVFERDGWSVRNKAFDPALLEDPSLIIYDPIRHFEQIHIVTNGDQTDTIYEGLQQSLTFEQSLKLREFEPDAPHYTPRISAIIDTDSMQYCLSILKTKDNDPTVCLRSFYHYSRFKNGIGHCMHTYSSSKNGVLQPFEGEPFETPLFDTMEETAAFYWLQIHPENKIAMVVKFIDVKNGKISLLIHNKNESVR